MNTLLLRLAGPMQSWGTQSRFSIRDGSHEPSKSGVVGLLCAALGRPRDIPVDDLAALRMGIRVDRPGRPSVDFQTAGGTRRADDGYGVAKASGARPDTVISSRHYLADASFLVGLESPDVALLQVLEQALGRPRWQLSLGRKSYVPSEPVLPPQALRLGEPLEDALSWYPLPDRSTGVFRLVVEVPTAEGDDVRQDQPFGTAFRDRTFGARSIATRPFTAYRKNWEDDDVPLAADPQSAQ